MWLRTAGIAQGVKDVAAGSAQHTPADGAGDNETAAQVAPDGTATPALPQKQPAAVQPAPGGQPDAQGPLQGQGSSAVPMDAGAGSGSGTAIAGDKPAGGSGAKASKGESAGAEDQGRKPRKSRLSAPKAAPKAGGGIAAAAAAAGAAAAAAAAAAAEAKKRKPEQAADAPSPAPAPAPEASSVVPTEPSGVGCSACACCILAAGQLCSSAIDFGHQLFALALACAAQSAAQSVAQGYLS